MERPQEPPPEPAADDRPATLGDVRALRRWVLVAGVWAVAASAVALIALLDSGDDRDDTRGDDTAAQLARMQRQLDSRIDDLDDRIADLPQSGDVSKLDSRLQELENGSGRASDRLDGLSDDLSALEREVDELEQQVSTSTTTTTTP